MPTLHFDKKEGGPISELASTPMKCPAPAQKTKNPNRVAAGRRNWSKRRGFTPEGLERLRQAALQHRPWEHSTGPRTAAGRAISALNRRRKSRPNPLLEQLREIRNVLLAPAAKLRQAAAEAADTGAGN